jgi:hypothetical protein
LSSLISAAVWDTDWTESRDATSFRREIQPPQRWMASGVRLHKQASRWTVTATRGNASLEKIVGGDNVSCDCDGDGDGDGDGDEQVAAAWTYVLGSVQPLFYHINKKSLVLIENSIIPSAYRLDEALIMYAILVDRFGRCSGIIAEGSGRYWYKNRSLRVHCL